MGVVVEVTVEEGVEATEAVVEAMEGVDTVAVGKEYALTSRKGLVVMEPTADSSTNEYLEMSEFITQNNIPYVSFLCMKIIGWLKRITSHLYTPLHLSSGFSIYEIENNM